MAGFAITKAIRELEFTSANSADPVNMGMLRAMTNAMVEVRSQKQATAEVFLLKHYFPSQTDIHAGLLMRYANPGGTTKGTLDMYQPVGYETVIPSQIAQDLVVHQGHVGHLKIIKAKPTHDQDTTNWTRSGILDFFNDLNEGTEIVPTTGSDRVFTATRGAKLVLLWEITFPSNVVKIREIVMRQWSSFQINGEETGINFITKYFHSAVKDTPGSGTQIGLASRGTIIAHPSTATGDLVRFEKNNIQDLDLTPTSMSLLEVSIEATTEVVGGAPDPKWWIYSMDIDIYCEIDDIDLVDKASFDTLDLYFDPAMDPPILELKGDFFDMDVTEAVLLTIDHAPEMVIYVANDGKLTAKKWPLYSDTGSPYEIGPAHGNYRHIQKSFADDGLFLTDAEYTYESQPESGATTSPGVTSSDNDLNISDTTDGRFRYKPTAAEGPVKQARELIQSLTEIERYGEVNSILFGQPIKGKEIAMPPQIFRIEHTEIIALDVPELGLSSKKYMVDEMEIDLDKMNGVVTVIDREFVEPT